VKEVKGDIWSYWIESYPICITVNGCMRQDGCAVMGRGVAAQAARRIPELPARLGGLIVKYGWEKVYQIAPYILSFPVKRDQGVCDGSNVVHHMAHKFRPGDLVPGWALKAEVEIIADSLVLLHRWVGYFARDHIVLPRPGCGAGELDWETQVKPLCAKYGDWLWVIEKE
jgi:hypothetical protein